MGIHKEWDKPKALEMYEQGFSMLFIADSLGVCQTSVCRLLTKNGIKPDRWRRSVSVQYKLKTDYSEAIKMYEAGMSIAEIAEFYGVGPSSIWSAFRRRNVAMRRKGKPVEDLKPLRGKNDKARLVTQKAIKRGILSRSPCEVCGIFDKSIEAHHDDYNKPLDLHWFCPEHHREWHKRNKPIQCR